MATFSFIFYLKGIVDFWLICFRLHKKELTFFGALGKSFFAQLINQLSFFPKEKNPQSKTMQSH